MKMHFASLATLPLLWAGLAVAQSATASDTWTIDPMHSQADFEVRHMGVSNVRGALSHITGTVKWDTKNPTKSIVSADIDTSTVNTGNDMRDKDLKSDHFFDIQKYPSMHFQSTAIRRSGNQWQLIGDLTLAGVTKPVTLLVDGPVAPQKGMQGGLVSGLSATGTIRRSDFNFGSKFGPPMIGDDVKLTLDVEIDQK